jgi:hypothetical protein
MERPVEHGTGCRRTRLGPASARRSLRSTGRTEIVELEEPVEELHRDRPLADRRRHPTDRSSGHAPAAKRSEPVNTKP